MLFRQAHGLRIRKSGSVAGPGIKIRAKVTRIRVPSPYPANDGRIRTLVFFISDFSFSLMPLDHEKKRCRAKAKAKANKKKSNPDFFFFGLDVFFWFGLSFSFPVWPFSFLTSGQAAD